MPYLFRTLHRSCAIWGSTAVLSALTGVSLAAQSVSGTVLGANGRPAFGAVVELLDSTSTPVTRALAGSTGAFVLRSLAAGRYVVRARQVGWRPTVSSPIDLRTGVTDTITLRFVGSPISLDTIRVAGRSVCGRASDSTSAVVNTLEYARTALIASDVVRTRGWSVTSLRFERRLDPLRERIVSQTTRVQRDPVAQPWVSFPIESLRRNGYVVDGAGDSVIYRLPGLDMLASTAFVDDHCFEFNSKSDKKRIGVSFEPAPSRRRVTDMRGTLWLDRTTAALQSLEFRYTGLSGAQDDAKPGGEMQFAQLVDGTWSVTQWSVRMPLLERRLPVAGMRVGSGVPENVVAGILVNGGQIAAITNASGSAIDTLWARPGIVVAGALVDSLSDRAVPNARVEVRGTSVRTVTDADGKFVLPALIPGEYWIDVRTTSLDSVRSASSYPLSLVSAADNPALRLKVANAASITAMLCPVDKNANASTRGVLVGQVNGDARIAAANASVVIEWPTGKSDGTSSATQWIVVRTDESGGFRLCGVPTGVELVVRASTARPSTTVAAASAPVALTIAPTLRFGSAELQLDSTRSATAVFTGTVVVDSTFSIVSDAEVTLPALNRSVRTNAEGRFRLSDLPTGTQRVVVRRLGYTPVDAQLTFAANDIVDRRVVLGKVSVLDSVVVRADYTDPGMRDFDERRRLGIGTFITRAQLDIRGGTRLAEILASTQVNLRRLGANLVYAVNGRRAARGASCFFFEGAHGSLGKDITKCLATTDCYMQVYLDNTPLFQGRDDETVPNLGNWLNGQLEGVEIYSGGAQTPAQYSSSSSTCGVVVLRRRRT